MAGDDDRTGLADDVRAMLRDSAIALKADLESGTSGLVGVAAVPDRTDREHDMATVAPVIPPDTSIATVLGTLGSGITPVPLPEPAATNVADTVPAVDVLDALADEPVQLSLFGDWGATLPRLPHHGSPSSSAGILAAA